MQCLYCNTKLDPLRVMADGRFCSDDHSLLHEVDRHTKDSLYLFPEPEPAKGQHAAPLRDIPKDEPFEVECTIGPLEMTGTTVAGSATLAGMIPMTLLPDIRDWIESVSLHQPKIQNVSLSLPPLGLLPITAVLKGSRKRKIATTGLAGSLLATPTYWKIAASFVPVMLFASFNPGFMNSLAHAKETEGLTMSKPLQQVKDSIKQRAAVILTDDFRSGLDSWASRSNLANAWAYDPNGFVRPGTLAVYRPSMGMTDYTLEFLTQVEKKAVGAAFRVEDWTHYYALKLVVTRQGQSTSIDAVHYTVVNGKEVNRVVRPLNITMGNTTLHRIRLDVHGNDFTLINQGKIVDYWSDGRYSKGGVGFFCGKGERAGVRWVEVSHQQDLLGRFCAFLTPDDGQGTKSGLE